MYERNEQDTTIVSSRRATPSSEIDPRQLAALLRIEDRLIEIRDRLPAPSPVPAAVVAAEPPPAGKPRKGA